MLLIKVCASSQFSSGGLLEKHRSSEKMAKKEKKCEERSEKKLWLCHVDLITQAHTR